MSTQKVQFEIDVSNDGALKSVDTLGKKAVQLEKQLELERKKLARATEALAKATGDTENEERALNAAQKAVLTTEQQLITTRNKLNQATETGAEKTRQANMTLLNFNRVVQDAPFGILGVANNIDPLVSSFQQLQKETGSTVGALKGMAGALMGPMGVGLAISAVTSALITFGPQIKSLFTGNVVDATDAAKEYVKALDDIAKGYSTAFGLNTLEDAESRLKLLNEQLKEQQALIDAFEEKQRAKRQAGGPANLATIFQSEGTGAEERVKQLREEILNIETRIAELKRLQSSDSANQTQADIERIEALKQQSKELSAQVDAMALPDVQEFLDGQERLNQLYEQRAERLRETQTEEEAFYAMQQQQREETEAWFATLQQFWDASQAREKDVVDAYDDELEALIATVDMDLKRTEIAERNSERRAAAEQAAQEQAAAAIGRTVAAAIMAGDDMRSVAVALINQTLAEVIAISIKGAFIANPVLGAFIAPVAAGLAVAAFNQLVPKFATGVENFTGGMALVGEQGPEVVTLPAGSNVVSNENTRALLNNIPAATAGQTVGGADMAIAEIVKAVQNIRVMNNLYDFDRDYKRFQRVVNESSI